ncbi:hypothetical protein YA36_05910 [Klebsiella aerogenes]|nr:hypothetical protein YA36_05910 [Klebsiella aerogenes]KLF71180.1 hypothetical protein YA39_15590 [Klebsiella aerogenes]
MPGASRFGNSCFTTISIMFGQSLRPDNDLMFGDLFHSATRNLPFGMGINIGSQVTWKKANQNFSLSVFMNSLHRSNQK